MMEKSRNLTPLQAVNEIRNNNGGQVALVLQGGGALGAYQCGVYQALHEAGVEPDWIIGTSIGAINAAIIAGNRVEDRLPTLQKFWRRVESSTFWGAFPALTGVADALSSWSTLTSGIPGFFETNIRAFLGAHVPFERRLIGEILSRIEGKGLTITALELKDVGDDLARRHYAEHDGKPFFASLLEFITSGPVVAAIVEGPRAVAAFRQIAGATDPVEKAAPGTIRGDLALDHPGQSRARV